MAHDMAIPGLAPEPETRALLGAALLDGEPARAAFAGWLARRVPSTAEALPSVERRLLPLVAKNLAGFEHPFLAACEEVRRKAATRNGRLMAAAAEAIAVLHAAGIETLALKGLALIREHYGDPGLRPMADIDLMVRAPDRPRAVERLVASGWAEVAAPPPALAPYLCAFDLQRDGLRIDLHQYLIEYGSTPADEADLWRRAHPLALGGADTRAPAREDLLVHVCLAALKVARRGNSRWIVDAAQLLPGPLDWELTAAIAERRGGVLALRAALPCLAGLGLPVPPAALAALARARPRATETLMLRTLTREPATAREFLEWYTGLYLFGARAAGRLPNPAGFLDFVTLWMQSRWRLPSRRQLPAALVRHLGALRARR